MIPEFITCAVWPFDEQRSTGRRYRPYSGKCGRCGIKLALPQEVKAQRDADPNLVLLCPQCTDSQNLENGSNSGLLVDDAAK